MHTSLSPEFTQSPLGQQAKELIAKCVHCGFCNATCPTYQLLGDELDGPRGRIYLMKEMFEGKPVSAITQKHLDRCLTCRACETTCPSGVQYSQLLDLGRRALEERVERPLKERIKRKALVELVARPTVFKQFYRVGRAIKPILPSTLQNKLHTETGSLNSTVVKQHARKMLVLGGCVQPTLAPNTNLAAARVLDHLGIQLITAPEAGCCGAVRHHAGDKTGAQNDARKNIDAWWPFIESKQVEAIIMTASGCGSEVQDYGRLLNDDPSYAEKAATVADLCTDISVVIQNELAQRNDLPTLQVAVRVAVQEPCTFQHALRKKGSITSILQKLGYETTPVADSHLCCGSAGTYSILQPKISHQLRKRKLDNLMAGSPAIIASANIGCQTHLQETSVIPVQHWIELVDRAYTQETTH